MRQSIEGDQIEIVNKPTTTSDLEFEFDKKEGRRIRKIRGSVASRRKVRSNVLKKKRNGYQTGYRLPCPLRVLGNERPERKLIPLKTTRTVRPIQNLLSLDEKLLIERVLVKVGNMVRKE